jgi:tight adherence protein B
MASAVLGPGIAGAAGAMAGPVAGVLAAVYAVLGVLAWSRIVRNRARVRDWGAALDALSGIAADLRAGLPPEGALAVAAPRLDPVPRVSARVTVACRVAETTGAPLADLFDRLELDLRNLDRIRLTAAAQGAGVRATAVLLAALPVAGIGVGYGMGADPLFVLLHTPVGAVCAGGAVLLQVTGLAWTARLAEPPGGSI